MDPPESRRRRPGGVSAKGLRAGGNDRRRAAAVEMLQKRLEEAATSEIGGLSAAEGAEIRQEPDGAHRGYSGETVRLSKSHRYRGQRMGTHAFDLREETGAVNDWRMCVRLRAIRNHKLTHGIVSIASELYAHRI